MKRYFFIGDHRNIFQKEGFIMTEKKLFKSRREGILNNFIEARCSCGPCRCTICGACTDSASGTAITSSGVSNVSVNSSNAVDKREQPPRKDGCSLFHVNAGLRRKKMERRLQEKQIPIGLLSKQIVLQVEEAAQLSGRSIRYKVEEPVSQVALVLKDV